MKKEQKTQSEEQKREVSMAEIKEKMQQNAFPINLDDANYTEEKLITYKEFM